MINYTVGEHGGFDLKPSARSIYGIHERILSKIDEFSKLLQDYSSRKPAIKSLVEELTRERENLKMINEPLIMSKNYIDSSLKLLRMLNNAVFILSREKENITSEDIRSITREIITAIKNYVKTTNREVFKSKLTISVPIYVAAVTFIIAYFYRLYVTGNSSIIDATVALLGLTGLILSRINNMYAYLSIFIGALIGLFTVKLNNMSIADIYLVMIYLLIIATSGFYFQIIKNLRSGRVKTRIEELLNEFDKIDKKIREAPLKKPSKEEALRIEKIEEMLRRIFREKYGLYGDKLLEYKLNVLIMHGKTREEALKQLLKQLQLKNF